MNDIGFIPVKDTAEQTRMMTLLGSESIDCERDICRSSGVPGIVFYYQVGDSFTRFCTVLSLSNIAPVIGHFPLLRRNAKVWINRPGLLQQKGRLVTFSGNHVEWRGERLGRAEELLTKFAEAIGRPIVFSVPHSNTRAVRTDDHLLGPFEVLIWSSPYEPDNRRPPEYIWGYETSCRNSGYHQSGEGIAIVDDTTGWCVAELFPHQLYVHHDLCQTNRDVELDILERLLEEVLPHMVPTAADLGAALLRQFQALCNRGHSRVLKETRASIEADEHKLVCLQEELTQVRERLEGRKLKLTQLEGVVSDADKQATAYAALRNHRMVAAMKIEYGVIEVTTPRLYAADPRTSVIHRLGVQAVTIHPDGKNGGVRFVCKEGNISGTGRAVPHATKEGFIVHPDALPAIAELLACQQFNEVFDVAIQAATEVVSDHPQGADLVKWPHATPAELIGTEWEGQQVSIAA